LGKNDFRPREKSTKKSCRPSFKKKTANFSKEKKKSVWEKMGGLTHRGGFGQKGTYQQPKGRVQTI